MAKYQHHFPVRSKRPKYKHLFTEADKAKMAYNNDMSFRRFVKEWNKNEPELMGWSLADFYKAYLTGGYQLTIAF